MIDTGEVFKADLRAFDRLLRFEYGAGNPVRIFFSARPDWVAKNVKPLELVRAGKLRHRAIEEIGLISLKGFSEDQAVCIFEREGRISGVDSTEEFIGKMARGLRDHSITNPVDGHMPRLGQDDILPGADAANRPLTA